MKYGDLFEIKDWWNYIKAMNINEIQQIIKEDYIQIKPIDEAHFIAETTKLLRFCDMAKNVLEKGVN